MLAPVRRARLLILPWLFVVGLAFVYIRVGWPLVASGHAPAIVLGILLTSFVVSAVAAAVAVTRDVIGEMATRRS